LATHEDDEAPLKQMVEELMMDTVKANRAMVPDTGVDPEWEYNLSSIFIDAAKGQVKIDYIQVLPQILYGKRDHVHPCVSS
jgi:uncharacterized protein with NRDE domain